MQGPFFSLARCLLRAGAVAIGDTLYATPDNAQGVRSTRAVHNRLVVWPFRIWPLRPGLDPENELEKIPAIECEE